MTEARDAATVLLLRDRPDLHVFVLRRTPRAVFGPGASVFPGGAVDADDRSAEVHARVAGLDDAAASVVLGLREGGLGYWVAAVRECFEESGFLLACDAGTGHPVDLTDPGRVARVEAWRHELVRGAAPWSAFLAAEDLLIDTRDLRVFAHWRTPIGAPRRYDTWFFVAVAPRDQEGAHDEVELVDSDWTRPDHALARHDSGEIDLITPTRRSLEVLAGFVSTEEAIAALDGVPRDELGRPDVMRDSNGERVRFAHESAEPGVRWTIPLPDRMYRTATVGVGEVAS